MATGDVIIRKLLRRRRARLIRASVAPPNPPPSADVVKSCARAQRADPPPGWVSLKALSALLKSSPRSILRHAEPFRAAHPDWFGKYLVSGRRHYSSCGYLWDYFAPALAEKIVEMYRNRLPPEGWRHKKQLERELRVDEDTIARRAETHRESHPDWFGNYRMLNGQLGEFYAPGLVTLICREIYPDAPDGWMNAGAIAKVLKSDTNKVDAIANRYRRSHPEWFAMYRHSSGQQLEHFAPKLKEQIAERLGPLAPPCWYTRRSASLLSGERWADVSREAGLLRAVCPQLFGKFRVGGRDKGFRRLVEHFAPEVLDRIKEALSSKRAPEGWVHKSQLAKELGVSADIIKLAAHKYRRSHPYWFAVYRPKGARVTEYFSPQLANVLRKELARIKKSSERRDV